MDNHLVPHNHFYSELISQTEAEETFLTHAGLDESADPITTELQSIVIVAAAPTYSWETPLPLACLADIHYQPHLLTKVFFYDDFDLPSPIPLKKNFFSSRNTTLYTT